MSQNTGNTGSFIEGEQYGKNKKKFKDVFHKQRVKPKSKRKK